MKYKILETFPSFPITEWQLRISEDKHTLNLKLSYKTSPYGDDVSTFVSPWFSLSYEKVKSLLHDMQYQVDRSQEAVEDEI